MDLKESESKSSVLTLPAFIRRVGVLQTEMLSWGDNYRVNKVMKI